MTKQFKDFSLDSKLTPLIHICSKVHAVRKNQRLLKRKEKKEREKKNNHRHVETQIKLFTTTQSTD